MPSDSRQRLHTFCLFLVKTANLYKVGLSLDKCLHVSSSAHFSFIVQSSRHQISRWFLRFPFWQLSHVCSLRQSLLMLALPQGSSSHSMPTEVLLEAPPWSTIMVRSRSAGDSLQKSPEILSAYLLLMLKPGQAALGVLSSSNSSTQSNVTCKRHPSPFRFPWPFSSSQV